VSDEQPQIPWYESSNINHALGLIVSAVFGLAHLTKWDQKLLGFDIDNIDKAQAKDIITFAFFAITLVGYPIYAGIVWILKRVKAGKDPCNPQPGIKTPAPVAATVEVAKRVTREITKPEKE
jgi:hypothetical protein